MLISGSRLLNAPVMGLQTGSELAHTEAPIVDPAHLQIIGYTLSGPLLAQRPAFLRIADVREFSDIGLIVDSSDEFAVPGDIIKLDEIYDLHFDIIDMKVVDEKKHKLGRVIGYTLDTAGFFIQQLRVKRPLLRSLNEPELLIHRSQITEINNDAIVVHSRAKIPEPLVDSLRTSYVNPFRKNPQAEHISPDDHH